MANKIFGHGDFSILIGAVAGGICFWGLVSIFSKSSKD